MPVQIKILIKSLLEFYDDPPKEYRGHISAITSVIGEELGTGLLIDYFLRKNKKAEVLSGVVTQGTTKGKRLDRWIAVTQGNEKTYFQVEIKNWAAHAIGGRRLAVDANSASLKRHKKERWSREWDGNGFKKVQVLKVLTPMKPPKENAHVEPLVCFWDAMHPTGAIAPLFSIPLHSKSFPRVWVFSMSSYLRNLKNSGEEIIVINSPAIKTRLKLLKNLLG